MAAHSETTKVDSGPNDSTKNKIEVTKNTPEDSLKLNKNTATFKTKFSSDSLESVSIKKSFEENDTKETFGDITLEGNIYIPQSDTTKEVYAYYFSGGENNEHKIGSIIEIMKKKGLVPADGKLLREVYDQNKNNSTFKNKTAWLLAPTPEGAVDDSRANQKVIATHTEKGSVNKIVESTKEFDIIEKVPITVSTVEVVIPEHAVFPTKNPQGIGKFEVDKNVPTDGYGYLFVKPIPIPENK